MAAFSTLASAPVALIGGFGVQEILLLVLLLALIFGARRLPEIGKGLGEGIRNFRGSMKEISGDDADKKSD